MKFCIWVDGRCPEFKLRQRAVLAAPDPASMQARTEGYPSLQAKDAACRFLADAKAKNETKAAEAKAAAEARAALLAAVHLPSVLLSSLPPLTQPCSEPGASGSVFKIEYQGKPAAVKKFHEHMRGMLSRELKTLQLLAHPNIVRVMAVMADAASQPVGFIME